MMLGGLHGSAALWILPLYFAVTLAVGWLARSHNRNSNEYTNASRSMPLWIVVAAYLASNCGALEIVGLSAMATQYGARAFHFYWIGAIPAMIFLSLFMMPVYRRSNVRSVPEYLLLRYGPRIRLLNATATAITLLLLSGISLYAMAQVLEVIVGLSFVVSILCCAGVVLTYILLGGIRATVYNEVLQLALMLAGLVPLAYKCLKFTHPHQLLSEGSRVHLWTTLPAINPKSQMDMTGVVLGLGFVLSFGYWCTDFVLMQRAFTARTESDARLVPLWSGFGKLVFSLIVVLPGLAAYRLLPALGTQQRFDQALPALMQTLYSPTMVGVGLTALTASLMSGLASNVSAFAALWTEDIYRISLRPDRPERHYVRTARAAVVAAILISVAASYLNFFFTDLMEHVQLIFSVFAAPFWAIFLLGMTTRRTSERGAILGFVTGAAFSFVHSLAVTRGYLHYGSTMSSNFYAAIYAFCIAIAVGWMTSASTHANDLSGLVIRLRNVDGKADASPLLWTLSFLLLLCCLLLNIVWR